MKKIMKAAENILFITAVIIIIAAAICQITNLRPVVVLSGSMEPELKTGSMAFIDTKDKDIEKGDVISFKNGDVLVSHRVTEITEDGYKTKGDNNDDEDEGMVRKENVEGTVLFSVPGMGYFLKTKALPAGIVITLLYLIMKVIYREREYEKNK